MEFYDTDQLSSDIAKRSYANTLLRMNPNGNSPILAMSGLAKNQQLQVLVILTGQSLVNILLLF